jgi:hypothetical protein
MSTVGMKERRRKKFRLITKRDIERGTNRDRHLGESGDCVRVVGNQEVWLTTEEDS